MRLTTINGYSTFDVISALQKEIRRGNEKESMFWALELAYSDKSTFTVLINRLKIISYENIGLADTGLVCQISQGIDDIVYIRNNSTTDEWDIILADVILMLCRAKKSRIADHFKVYMKGDYWKNQKLTIPDYTFDYHTRQGKRMGRKKTTLEGFNHFIKDGEKLMNEDSTLDIYKDDAHKVWRRRVVIEDCEK